MSYSGINIRNVHCQREVKLRSRKKRCYLPPEEWKTKFERNCCNQNTILYVSPSVWSSLLFNIVLVCLPASMCLYDCSHTFIGLKLPYGNNHIRADFLFHSSAKSLPQSKYIRKQDTLEPNLLSPAGSNNLKITANSKIQTCGRHWCWEQL